MKTTDMGTNWEEISLPDSIHLFDILIPEFDLQSTVIGGGYKGDSPNNSIIISSRDGGLNWDVVTSIGGSPVMGLGTGDGEDRTEYIYYATVDSGVFRVPLSLVTIENEIPDIPKSFYLSHNYPNPFNSSTTITYTLPHTSDISLVIYDLTGREVMRWDETGVQAGTHHRNWNGTDKYRRQVASGIYFYRLVAGGFSEVKKMLLLK